MNFNEIKIFRDIQGDCSTKIGRMNADPKATRVVDTDDEEPFFDLSMLTRTVDLFGNIREENQ